ncbi:hypothetical protein M9458_057347, partial [Cirrhinus mrigala]
MEDLSFSDAGKYFLIIYYCNDQAELKRKIRTYQLHIHDEIALKKGKPLQLDILLPNVNKVQHQSRSSTEWKVVWSRSHRVQSERITDHDGNLTILQFMDSDAGSYRVLDSEGEILITVTVT